MIKGINRRAIEVSDVGSEYYEKAFLIVRPEYADYQERLLEREARKMLKNLGAPSSVKKNCGFAYWAVRLGGAAAIGATLASALCRF